MTITKENFYSQDSIAFLEKVQDSNKKLLLPKDLKPCIAMILGTPINKGDYPNRNDLAIILAVELRKSGLNSEQVEKRLQEWNYNNNPPLTESQLNSILRSSSKSKQNGSLKYDYGCNNFNLQAFCINPEDKEDCYYYLKNFKNKNIKIEPDYISLGWQNKLTLSQRYILFYGIPYIEKRRGFNCGSHLFVTVRELSQVSGMETKYFKKNLIALKNYGLIEYVIGSPRVWERKASKIRRIIPPPRPP